MVVDRYSDKYREDIEWLVRCFQDEALKEYGLSFDENALSNTIDELKDQAFLLIVDGKCEGLLAGKEVKTPLSDDPIWHEVIWYISEKYRRYGVFLLRHARKVLKEEGYTSMVMIALHSSKTQKLFKLYNKMGFVEMETHFIGRL